MAELWPKEQDSLRVSEFAEPVEYNRGPTPEVRGNRLVTSAVVQT